MEAVKYKTKPKHLGLKTNKQTNYTIKQKSILEKSAHYFLRFLFKIVIRKTFPKFWHIAQWYWTCFKKNVISKKNGGGMKSQYRVASWCPIPNFNKN